MVKTADLLTPPARRDVKTMTSRLAELKAGHHVSATIRYEKYGVFRVEGQASWSDCVKNFLVGGLTIESGLKPDKALLALAVGGDDVVSIGEAVSANYGEYESVRELIDSVGHGDVVRATFEQKPYGQFTVTGIAVQTADRAVTAVGSMFLRRAIHLEVLGTASEFNLATPKTLVWDVESSGIA
ncbi:hypothetical protein [Umezawaea sp. Da 62-37]|uniref:hypothetical protein n=1 Tax=Umezawaea sp. Da 62-37 TaxID=3075927 RepID=UPI0028F74D76|nr:hypothetical protein [Umezawaea sp. Da 62-37]WNV83594.1 hypothetical protein RM788_36240 [Umezawaea sp. Da 62-37]